MTCVRKKNKNVRQDFASAMRWKVEAIMIIEQWEECFNLLKAADVRIPLGVSKPAFVKAWIQENLPKREVDDET